VSGATLAHQPQPPPWTWGPSSSRGFPLAGDRPISWRRVRPKGALAAQGHAGGLAEAVALRSEGLDGGLNSAKVAWAAGSRAETDAGTLRKAWRRDSGAEASWASEGVGQL